MKIGEIAEKAGMPTKTVRYYADIGLVEPHGRSVSGYRTYDDPGLKKLVFVRRAREFGFSINDCRGLLDLYEDQERSSADVKSIAQKRLSEIEEKQRELAALHETLTHLVHNCKGDKRPDCPIIDFLG